MGLPDIDWKAGAASYVQGYFDKYGKVAIGDFIATKPLSLVAAENPERAAEEISAYLSNFANTVNLLKLPPGARVLDVACGGGWLAHWMSKLGYEAYGFDLSADFISLARDRLRQDPHLKLSQAVLDDRFWAHDIETSALSDNLQGSFDAIILESCLHHFFNPISALRHLSAALKPSGAMVILEGENRRGEIAPEYMRVMLETSTLERPLPRRLLIESLEAAQLDHIEFLASAPNFYPASTLGENEEQLLRQRSEGTNFCVAAKSGDVIDRIFARAPARSETVSTAQDVAAREDIALDEPSKKQRGGLIRRILRRLRSL